MNTTNIEKQLNDLDITAHTMESTESSDTDMMAVWGYPSREIVFDDIEEDEVWTPGFNTPQPPARKTPMAHTNDINALGLSTLCDSSDNEDSSSTTIKKTPAEADKKKKKKKKKKSKQTECMERFERLSHRQLSYWKDVHEVA